MNKHVKNLDAEDLGYTNDPGFWNMIADRRKESLVSSDHIRSKIEAAEKKTRSTKKPALTRKKAV